MYKFDIDIPNLYMHTKMDVQSQGIRNLEPEQDIQTRRFAPVACLNQMTFTYESNMYPLKAYLHSKIELFRSMFSKFTYIHTYRQTDRFA